MVKTCKFCNKDFIAEGKNSGKKIFCNTVCQQEYWLNKRNVSGKKTRNNRLKAKESRLTKISEEQEQIILGGMMGDSSISVRNGGSCRLKMSHSEKQLDYLIWKKNILEPLFIQESPTVVLPSLENKFINGQPLKSTTSYHFSSIVHPLFNDFYGTFYSRLPKRKVVNMNILNRLKPLGVFIWFIDDGSYSYQPQKSTHIMYLSTNRYTLSEHLTIKRWFWHTWGIESVITHQKRSNNYILRFNIAAQKRFNELFINPFRDIAPTCIHYKFPNF